MTDTAGWEEEAGGPRGSFRNSVLGGAVAFAVAGVLTLLAGPLLYRSETLDVEQATVGVEQIAMGLFSGGLVLVVIGLAMSFFARAHRGVIVAVVAGIANGYGFGHLLSQAELRNNLPPLWDTQTDWTQPVAFSEKTLEARKAAKAVEVRDDAVLPASAGVWFNIPFAKAQTDVYDLMPLSVPRSVADATAAAVQGAQQLGWTVTSSDAAAGTVEAVSTTFWYGFVSDIAVRIQPEAEGSRIDIRSTSRIPMPDMGANASQVKALVNEIALILR